MGWSRIGMGQDGMGSDWDRMGVRLGRDTMGRDSVVWVGMG